MTRVKCPDLTKKCPEIRDKGRDISAGDTEGTPFGGFPLSVVPIVPVGCPDFCPVSSSAVCGRSVEGT